MALSGRLEDMNVLEILQIVSFSKRTGSLEIDGPVGRGAVVFREGHIQCAISESTHPLFESLLQKPQDSSRLQLLHSQIRVALQELVALRQGTFEFRVTPDPSVRWKGLDVGSLLLTEGVESQALMLELARALDESRREGASLLESSGEPNATIVDPATTPFPESGLTVVIADDEEQVARILAEALSGAGSKAEIATGVAEASELVRNLLATGSRLALVIDVAMPSSGGESFQGGFEIVELVKEMDADVPILLTAESISPQIRSRAKWLGIAKIAHKPALTKLDPDEYDNDLRSFAATIVDELTSLIASPDEATPTSSMPRLNHAVMFDFLKTMAKQLLAPGNVVARVILRVASRYAERVLLFLVKESRARGLAGVQVGRLDRQVCEAAKKLILDLQDVQPFAEVVYSRGPLSGSHDTQPLPPELEPGRAKTYALLPLMLNHEVLAIIYLDNPISGMNLAHLSGLEVFLAQAGMAMENASLQRRVLSIGEQFSLEDQGPLTQELAPFTRSSKP
ncbi:MAG TPA: response regulator [Vicinamibacteria bacterium]|nr:response regulator [Vicinamibacteria bacterium]